MIFLLFFFKLEWTDVWDVTTLIIGFVLGASLVIGAIGVIYSKAAKPFYIKWIKPVKDAETNRIEVLAKVDNISDKVDKIAGELQTNGGESLKDSVQRIEVKVDYANSKLKFRDQLSENPVFEMDALAHCLFVNRALCEALHIDEHDFLDRRWLSRICGDKSELLGVWLDASANKIPIMVEYAFNVNGGLKKGTVRAEPALDRRDELVGYMCLIHFQS